MLTEHFDQKQSSNIFFRNATIIILLLLSPLCGSDSYNQDITFLLMRKQQINFLRILQPVQFFEPMKLMENQRNLCFKPIIILYGFYGICSFNKIIYSE